MFTQIIPAILKPILKIIDKSVADEDERIQLQHLMMTRGYDAINTELNARKSVLVAELSGDSWLGKNWRPITMLTFVALIVAYWLGFTAKNISDAVVVELLTIVKIGIGGYVLGRSGEKIMKMYKND